MSNSWDSLLGGSVGQNMIGAPTPEPETEEEKRKKAEAWLSGIAQNPLGALGDLASPLDNGGRDLTKVEDFAARSVLSAGKKLSATMDTLRLIEEQSKNGGLQVQSAADHFNSVEGNYGLVLTPGKALAASWQAMTGPVGDFIQKQTGHLMQALPSSDDLLFNTPQIDAETQSILSDFTQKTDQTVNMMKAQFEAEHGGMTEGMKMLGQAQDWSQIHAAFKEDKWGILRDMGTEAAGQIIALAATRKLPGGASGQITGAGALSFGFNFGTNVQDSLAQGKKVNEALDDGLTKTYADVLGDTLGLGLAGIKYAKKKIYDRMWQFGADSIGSTLLMKQSREAVDEDMSFGDLVANFGSNIFFSTPAEIFSAVKEHKYEKSIKDALIPEAYKGNASENSFTNMSYYLDTKSLYDNVQTELGEGITGMLDQSGLDRPTPEENTASRTGNLENVNAKPEIPADKDAQFYSNVGGTYTFDQARGLMRQLDISITHGPNGGVLRETKNLDEKDFIPGKVTLAWDSRDNQRMRATLFEGDNGSPEAILVDRREKLQAEIERDVFQTAKTFINALLPNASIVISNKPVMAPRINDDGTRTKPNPEGAMTWLEPAADGTPRGIMTVNESKFFRQDDSTRQADGSPTLVYDKAAMLTTFVHEFGHTFIMNKIKVFSPEAMTGLRASYEGIMSSIQNVPFKDAVQIMFPKAMVPAALSLVPGNQHNIPFSQFKLNKNYVLSFREFLANQFAKAVFEDDKTTSILPQLKPFVDEIKAKTKMLESSLTSYYPDAQKALTNALFENVVTKQLKDETNKLKTGQRTEQLYFPSTENSTWNLLQSTAESIFQIEPSSIEEASNNIKLPEQERRALKRTMLAMGIDSAKTDGVDHHELAVTYDKYLQFESDVQAKWDQLNPITKVIQKLLGNDPKSPELIMKAKGSGRIASIAANLFQMTELNPNIQELQGYVKEHDAGVSERNQELHQADQLIQTLQNKPKAQLESLGKVLVDLTSGIFEKKHARVVAELRAKNTPGDAKQISVLARNKVMSEYGLPPEISKDISRIERYFRGKIHKLEALELSQVMEKWESGRLSTEQLKKTTANIKRRYTQVKSRMYFPLMRFGREAVVVRAVNDFVDPDGNRFKAGETVYRAHYESKAEADKKLEEFRDTLKHDKDVAVVRDTQDKRKTQTPDLPYGLFEGLQERLMEEGADDSIIREVQDYVREQARDNSFAKRLMERKGVAGAQTDVLRVIRRYAESYGAFYSGLAHTSKMNEAIGKLSRDIDLRVRTADDRPNDSEITQRAGLKAIRDYMQEHFDYIKSPAAEFEGLKALGFFWHLGFDVTSAVVNTTSIPIFVYPHLARFVDDSKAVQILSHSIQDITQGIKNNKSRITPDETLVLSALEKDGTLTQNLSLEFAALALDKSSRSKAVNKMKEFAHSALHSSAGMFQATEHFSRQVTALAAIRAAKERGVVGEKELQAFAKHTVRTTLFEYSRGNRAWLTRNWRSVLFLFQQFTHNGIYFMSRGNGASMRYLALMFAAAGAQGIPGGEDIMDMVDVLGNTLSKEKVDSRKGIREMMEGFGIDSDLVMHGGSRYAFGIPDVLNSVSGVDVPDVDLSSRLTAGRLIPFGVMSSANKLSSGGDLQDGATESLQNVSGAVGSIAWNALRGLDGIRKDPSEWKNYESMLPRAAKQLSSGIRWLVQGEETDSRGVPIVEFNNRDSHDVLQATGKMLGLNPTELTKKQELGYMQYQHYQYWTGQRGALLEQYRNFATQEMRSTGDSSNDEARRTMESIIDFNQTAPAGFQINTKTLKTSIRQGMLRDALKKQGYISGTVQSSSFKEYEDLFYNKPSTEPQVTIYE